MAERGTLHESVEVCQRHGLMEFVSGVEKTWAFSIWTKDCVIALLK